MENVVWGSTVGAGGCCSSGASLPRFELMLERQWLENRNPYIVGAGVWAAGDSTPDPPMMLIQQTKTLIAELYLCQTTYIIIVMVIRSQALYG